MWVQAALTASAHMLLTRAFVAAATGCARLPSCCRTAVKILRQMQCQSAGDPCALSQGQAGSTQMEVWVVEDEDF
eukprot:SAG31_NODE_29603_length_392_cov_1.389078_1_plen_74_part_10